MNEFHVENGWAFEILRCLPKDIIHMSKINGYRAKNHLSESVCVIGTNESLLLSNGCLTLMRE